MKDLISRQAAKNKKVYSEERHEYVVPVAEIDWLPSAQPDIARDIATIIENEQDMRVILNAPSAQSEIIRCKDCMHNGSFDTDCPIDWNGKEYCSFAERKEDE